VLAAIIALVEDTEKQKAAKRLGIDCLLPVVNCLPAEALSEGMAY
jgi:hypothetical protein